MHKSRTLTLHRETLRQLSTDALGRAVVGFIQPTINANTCINNTCHNNSGCLPCSGDCTVTCH